MIYSYDELLNMKKDGVVLSFDNITKEQLEQLFISNRRIAELYDVSDSCVRNRRRKWDISIRSAKYIYKSFANNNKELLDGLNLSSKERLLNSKNFDKISKALTHYLFRNGPVENMHAKGQLSQSDMKTLNQYMVNKIAGLLFLVEQEEWLKIELLIDFLSKYGKDWDKAELDTKEIDMIFDSSLGVRSIDLRKS